MTYINQMLYLKIAALQIFTNEGEVMEKQFMSQTFKVVFECPHCGNGEMNCIENQSRLIYSFGKPKAPPNQKPMAHRCSSCGFIMGLLFTYPYLLIQPLETEGFQTKGEA